MMHGGEEECIQDFGGKARRRDITRKVDIMLRGILGKWYGVLWVELIWLRIRTSGGLS
jgi:hypothetical protein